MGRWCTIIGLVISIGAAYLVMGFASIMDYVQALFSFFIAPLFGTVILGMLWKRATAAGGFWGLLAGTLSSVGMFLLVKVRPRNARHDRPVDPRQSHGRRYVSRPLVLADLRDRDGRRQPGDEAETRQRTRGLVYGVTAIPSEGNLRCSKGRSSGPASPLALLPDPAMDLLVTNMEKHHIIPVWFFVGVMLLPTAF